MNERFIYWLDRVAQRIDGRPKTVFNEFVVNYLLVLFGVVILLHAL